MNLHVCCSSDKFTVGVAEIWWPKTRCMIVRETFMTENRVSMMLPSFQFSNSLLWLMCFYVSMITQRFIDQCC